MSDEILRLNIDPGTWTFLIPPSSGLPFPPVIMKSLLSPSAVFPIVG